MSFLKNLRGSVTRKSNSAENRSFERNSSVSASTRKSVEIIKNSNRNESKGVIRSETFTIENHESIFMRNKTLIRSSMFGKLSTFGKKKKATKQRTEELKAQDDELSNSYKRYPTPSDVVASGSDPFNYLYQQGGGNGVLVKNENDKKICERGSVEYGTYRKSKLSPQAREQLEEIRNEAGNVKQSHNDSEKFKTVTISSFRKSFRDKFLNQKRDVPYNPSWFVEVETPKKSGNDDEERKSRPDLLVFENEHYRATARSPIRGDARSPSRSESRPTPTVKRNETFKIERENPEPSIRIEIKNSITPNEPGRIVPVGVAKPMQSSGQLEPNPKIIQRTWLENGNNPARRQKMFQTCIQITDETTSTNPRHPGQRSDTFIKNPAQSPQARIRNQNKNNSSEIFISNYSPLKSYELLSNMRRRTDFSPSRFKDGPKNLQENKNQGAAHSYGHKKWSQAPTFSSQQKISSHVTDKLVRKDVTNRNLSANTRRAGVKSPWR